MENSLVTVGWREWVALPDLGIPYLMAKIDSGQPHSILHAFICESFARNGKSWLRFGLHPHRHDRDAAQLCEAPLIELFDEEGETAPRYLINTRLQLGEQCWPIDLFVTQGEEKNYRLELGQTAIDAKLLIDPAESFLLGEPRDEELVAAYTTSQKVTQ